MAHALTVFTPDAQNKTICQVYTVSLKSLVCSSITGLPHKNIAVVQLWGLFLQLLEPCPILPFINIPPCHNTVKFWDFSVVLAGGGVSIFQVALWSNCGAFS